MSVNPGVLRPESLLVVWSGAAHEDLGLVLHQFGLELHQRLDDALEGGRHVGEVGNTAADYQNLTQWRAPLEE